MEKTVRSKKRIDLGQCEDRGRGLYAESSVR